MPSSPAQEAQPEPSSLPELASQELHDKLRPVLEIIPANKRAEVEKQVVSVALSVVEEYSGAVIHPRIARGWEEICPGAANRLLSMAEDQEKHRIWWERGAMINGVAFQYLGLVFALLVSISLVAGAVYCAKISQPWVSVAFLAASAVGMVKAFLEAQSIRRVRIETNQPPQTANRKAPTNSRTIAAAQNKKQSKRR